MPSCPTCQAPTPTHRVPIGQGLAVELCAGCMIVAGMGRGAAGRPVGAPIGSPIPRDLVGVSSTRQVQPGEDYSQGAPDGNNHQALRSDGARDVPEKGPTVQDAKTLAAMRYIRSEIAKDYEKAIKRERIRQALGIAITV